ncbi:MAG: glycosyltransferase family 2 protein [Thermoleophilia bacterium]|nr:glycosyltransferase family 2 protein [Thermoleophilia bacterium]
MEISVIIPAYNEEEAIGAVVREVVERASEVKEVIVVDDGSSDGTAAAAEQAGATVIRSPYNRGNGAAVKAGIRRATGEVVVMMDGDGQHKAEDIARLLAPIREGHDMVVGARNFGSQAGLHRGLANWLYNSLASYVAGHKIPDLTSGFRAIRRDVARKFLYLLPNTFSYPSTITLALFRSGYSVAYIPIEAARRVGQSKIRYLRDGSRFLLIITKIATLFAPIKVFLPFAAGFFLAGLGGYAYTFITSHRVTNLSAVAMGFGVQLFLLGLIAEQIAQLRFDRSED